MSVSSWVTIESSLMNGKSLCRVSPVPRAGVRSRSRSCPTGTRIDGRGCSPVRLGDGSRRLPRVVAVRLCRSKPENGHPIVRDLRRLTHPPRRRAGRHRRLPATIDHAPRHRSGKLPGTRRLPEPRAAPGRRTPRTRDRPASAGQIARRAPAARSVPQRVAYHGRGACRFEGGYMPAGGRDREGQDLQFAAECPRRLAAPPRGR